MRAVVVFAPCASPTYVPLGLATLAEYIRANVSGCEFAAVDLNIAAWHRVIDRGPGMGGLREFMRGGEQFYNKAVYNEQLETWKAAAAKIDHLIEQCKAYIETDILSSELEEEISALCRSILVPGPELVGFSILYPKQVIFSLAIAKFLKRRCFKDSGQKIVLGGATVSVLEVEELLKACGWVDAVFEGEGEAAMQMLCEGKSFESIAGLTWRDGEKIVRNGRGETRELCRIPMPQFKDFDLGQYFNPEPVLPVIFSRGCLWRKCRFCAHNFSYGKYRKREVKEFVNYLEEMRRGGVRNFYIADQYVDAPDLYELAREIRARGLDINFQVMCRPSGDYTAEVLRELSVAGCRWISWGVESGSQRLLDIINKGTEIATVKRVLKDSHEAGIVNLAMMIFGLPGGGEEDFRETLNFLDDVSEHVDDITCSSFVLFDKTPFAANAAKYQIEITGKEKLFEAGGQAVHSLRLYHAELSPDGGTRPTRGQLEISQWKIRRKWARWDSLYEDLCCEHFLLYAGRNKKARRKDGLLDSA